MNRETFNYCHCGTRQGEEHKFRHLFEPTFTLVREGKEVKDGSGKTRPSHTLTIDCSRFKTTEKEGNCAYFQCGKDRHYHNSGITLAHEFTPSKNEKSRVISLSIPPNTRCSSCGHQIWNHLYKHPPCVEIRFLNREEYDRVELDCAGSRISYEVVGGGGEMVV